MSMIIQKTIDNAWDATLFRIIPKWVRPNHLTIAKIIFLPIIVLVFYFGNFWIALALFIIAALFDSIDGALARKRNLISPLGTWLDPFADKLLIVVAIILIYSFYPYKSFLMIVAIIEIAAIIISVIVHFGLKEVGIVKADWWGKIKLALQVAGVVLIILFIISGNLGILFLSAIILSVAIVFSLASIFNRIYIIIKK
ncbi:MAG: CDP-alcohol phosphatidyltransferase family protein [Candidatus Buchananbacteria bacterium]